MTHARKSIKLTTSDRNELEYVTESVVTIKGPGNCVMLNKLDASQGPEVPMVNEFFDVFLRNCQSCHLTMRSSM
jgi:hypothetical protein